MEPENVDAPPAAGAWAPGKVAELLGVSPVTLRSWSARYGIGPPAAGRHRRYSDADVRRLQHMQRLITRGMPVREAAAAAFGGRPATGSGVPAADRVRELADAAEDLRYTSLAGLLDDALDTLGPAEAWTGVLAPLLRGLGDRWQRGDPCFAPEWALTAEISLAFERFSRRFPAAVPARPVLLACCPAERHSLPMEALRATLAEAGVPVAYAGRLVPAETLADLAARLDPVLVLLWSTAPATADDLLADRVRALGRAVGTAGPGWDHLGDRGFPRVNDLGSAVELAAGHAGG